MWQRGLGYFLCTTLMLSSGCSRFFKAGGGSVTVAKVRTELTAPQVTVAGQLVASDRAEIKFPYDVRIDKVLVNEGDRVTAGTSIVTLAPTDASARLAQLRAARKEAEATVEKNQFLLKNRDKMLEEGKIDATQHTGIESETRASEATLERIRAEISGLETEASATTIPCPINGVVHQKPANNGSVVGANQPILVIGQVDPIFVWFQLTADESMGIARDTPVRVRIEELGGEQFTAVVHHVGPTLNPQAETFDVWATIPNPQEGLKIGMRAFAEFSTLKQHQVFIVPTGAIITQGSRPYVFTVKQGVAHLTSVTVKGRTKSETTLADGVGPDDLVVVRGHETLHEGAMVDVWR